MKKKKQDINEKTKQKENMKKERKKERKIDHVIKVQHQHIPHPNLTTSQTRMPVEATQSPSPTTRWGDKTPDWMGTRGPDGDRTLDWLGTRDLD